MRLKKIIYILIFAATVQTAGAAALSDNGVLVANDPQNDFLLPSYFEAPAPQTSTAENTQVPTDIDILTEIFGEQAIPSVATQTTATTLHPSPQTGALKKEKTPLLTKLPPLPATMETPIVPPKRTKTPAGYVTKVYNKETGKSKADVTMPKDIRLQFNSGSSQLADSTIKWIASYALYAKKDPRLVLNIRVSSLEWATQQARLSLILQIILEKGLSVRQIQIFQSNRDPNTIIIGADLHPDQTRVIVPNEVKTIIKEQKTLSW